MSVHRMLVLVVVGLLAEGCAARATHIVDPPLPFSSDGCSAPNDALRAIFDRPEWRACCVVHDRAYWRGGTDAQRLAADAYLLACVAETGFTREAELMYSAVRMFGGPNTGAEFRWGFGWPK